MTGHKQAVVLVLLAALLNCGRVTAIDQADREKPALLPLVLASPSDVYGDAHTRQIEQRLLKLMTLAPRPAHGETSRTKADKIFAQMDYLVGRINDAEQLERLAYWCIEASKGPQPDSDLAIVQSAFSSSLRCIQKRYPSEARARIYDIASLVNADGHVGEEIDGQLTDDPASRPPPWSAVCCYVSLLKGKKYRYISNYDATEGAIDFNLTRFLLREWYPYWNGKYRYMLRCSFLLLPKGGVKNVAVEPFNFGKAPPDEVHRAEGTVRRILTKCCLKAHLPKFDEPVQVAVDFGE